MSSFRQAIFTKSKEDVVINKDVRLYIHIPFCLRKCAYCDFLSFSSKSEIRSRYLSALENEIRVRLSERKERNGGIPVSSVFFGGGTPTVLSGEDLAGILTAIRENAVIAENAEITCESNPCTLDARKAQVLFEAGFNRLSIGAQSMNDENLKLLGRLHDKGTFLRAFDNARKAGFSNLNLDMIFGLPGQTVRAWEEELGEAAALGSEHISVYALELYENTPLFAVRNRYRWPTDEELREMYDGTAAILAGHGLERYEISNYAGPGFESQHNSGYWTGDEYLGFGLGASSYETAVRTFDDSEKTGRDKKKDCDKKPVRYKNTGDMGLYLEKSGEPHLIRTDLQTLDKRDQESEFMVLGLRMTKGVSEVEFSERFGENADAVFGDVIEKYVRSGFLIREDGRIRLAEKALFVSNTILSEML